METRANYVLIGSFTLLVIAGIFAFVVWLAQFEFNRQYHYYEIHFSGSVSGLSQAADVRYNGLKVGQVSSMRLNPADPSQVIVVIEVNSDFPVYQNAIATMEYQGLTGVAYVEISGPIGGGSLLKAKQGQEYPVIASQPSNFQELFSGAPDLIKGGISLIGKLDKLVNEKNRKSFSQLLANAATISGNLSEHSQDFGQFLSSLQDTSKQVGGAAQSINTLASSLNGSVDTELKPMLGDARSAAKSADLLFADLNDLVQRNQDAVDVFASDGLVQFTRLMTETRQLVSNLSRLVDRIESDPARFFLGKQDSEFTPNEKH
ncbi:MAG TPA: MlaD family protein [Alphaproteobacteria bacterium]|nr:MlaD family protein [Alphaproteobacteria bacterium]